MTGVSEQALLKGVSRSFYLSLRLLPGPMRDAASLGYLLARTSDTLADSEGVETEDRLGHLSEFEAAMSDGVWHGRWPSRLIHAVEDPAERSLLEGTGDLMDCLNRLPEGEARLVREVVGIITSGQRMDLERFARADGGRPVALADAAALEDYAWRVAGCVGAFWTKLGFLTMDVRFSTAEASCLIERGICYGKGLQLVNILRDLPVDLANGRCYLPVEDALDRAELMGAHGRWLETAAVWVEEGFAYAETLASRRLRAATVLPAMIARETLDRMRGVDWAALGARVKVPRGRVYLALLRAFAGRVC